MKMFNKITQKITNNVFPIESFIFQFQQYVNRIVYISIDKCLDCWTMKSTWKRGVALFVAHVDCSQKKGKKNINLNSF